jgi:circadian clock protein KaiC
MNTNSGIREKTGIHGFDTIACGGLIPERLYLLDGDPGAGKTTFSLQYLLEGVNRRERCLYVTLSETKDELAAGAASHGWTLEGIEILELAAETAELDGENDLTMLNPSEVELTETVRK